jgi:hypothetical protein
MEDGSPSRHSWADEAQEELPSPCSLGAGSPGALASVFANDLGGHISFSDSEGYSDTEPPSSPPPGKGKTIVEQGGRRRHARRRRRHCPRAVQGFMAAARRSHQLQDPALASPCHPSSPVAHRARARCEPDADGFYEVVSRRRWSRRSPPKTSRPVPPALHGFCFNCLADNHIKADCTFPARCFSCHREGHRSFRCSMLLGQGKRRRSPPPESVGRRVVARRPTTTRRSASDATASGRSMSTGGSTSVPRCCAPPTPCPPPTAAPTLPAAGGPNGAPSP